jgi:DNA invertase Pin-like site-specific DNA recombinase
METSTTSTNTPLPVRAAQYVRMSTEHQQYSPENQLEVVRQYAASHNMEIVQEYSDHGRSGLNIVGREGLNKLMLDVESKRTDFSALLVYDVSRWGRFQDVDESAYYEYVLKRAGIRVHYCVSTWWIVARVHGRPCSPKTPRPFSVSMISCSVLP